MMYYEFDSFFTVMFVLVFAIVAVSFIVILVRGVTEWNNNNHLPKLSVEATCVAKRTNTTHHDEPVAGDISGAHGYRMEFHITGVQYGKLREGDTGTLSFQGTRFLSFDRHVSQREDVSFEIENSSDIEVEVE